MSIMLNFVVHCIFSTCFAFAYIVMFFAIGVYNSTTFFTRQTLMLLWQFAHIVISFKLTFHALNSQFFDTFTMFIC
jgi:hypothetical protein